MRRPQSRLREVSDTNAPELTKLDIASLGEKYISRLDVTVNLALRVKVLQPDQ